MAILDGRHALVTGGGRGIGRAIAASLSGAGATVTVLGRQEVALTRDPGRTFIARAAPVSGSGGGGAVLVLHDITDLRRADQIRRDFEYGTIEKRTAKARGRHRRKLHIPRGLSFRGRFNPRHSGVRTTSQSSWPGIAVRRTACFRTPMSRPSRFIWQSCALLSGITGTSPVMTA